jgi:alpha-1,3-glucan synthase
VYNESCEYPQFWDSEGRPQAIPKEKGCMASDFDQYGDMEAFGIQ